MKPLRMIAASALVMLLGLLAGCNAMMPSEFTEEEVQDDLKVGPNPRISVDSFNGPIEIATGTEGKLHYVIRKKATARTQEEADQDVENIDIQVKPTSDGVQFVIRQVNPKPFSNRSTHVNLDVPPGSVLNLKTSNGGIKSQGPVGDIVAESSNGGMDSRGSHGKLSLTTSNGPIHVEGGQGRLDLKTNNGGIRITSHDAVVDARTSNGPIHFDGKLLSGRNIFHTSNGGIRLDLPADSQFLTEANTSNGKVRCDFAVSGDRNPKKRQQYLKGKVGDDPSVTLDLNTSNGNIEIRKNG